MYFTEIFLNSESYLNHLSDTEKEIIGPIYSTTANLFLSKSTAVINADENHDGVLAMAHSSGASLVKLISGSICNQFLFEENRKTSLKPKASIMIELRLVPKENRTDRSIVLNCLKELSTIPNENPCILSAYVNNAWPHKSNQKIDEIPLIFTFIGLSGLFMKTWFTREQLARLLLVTNSYELVVTAENWLDDETIDFVKHLETCGLRLSGKRSLFAGFLCNPLLLTKKVSNTPKKEGDSLLDKKSSVFQFNENPVTGVAETVVFDTTIPKSEKKDGVLSIPLIIIIRKFLKLLPNEKELTVPNCFAQLARLRAIQQDAKAFNEATDEELNEENTEFADRMDRFLEVLKNMGYALPSPATGFSRPKIVLDSLDEFIRQLEGQFESVISNGREALNSGAPIEYMALAEVFPIGSLVTSDAVGGLGGTTVIFKVIDSYFGQMKSMLGGRKFSFKFVLESIITLSGEFISVCFDQTLEEWVGGKEINTLPFRPLKLEGNLPSYIWKRGSLLKSVIAIPSYKRYTSGSFFPHYSSQKRGGSTSTFRLASPGRLVVDSKMGLYLGHSPVTSLDDFGYAVAATVKAYKNAQRTEKENESESNKIERLKSSNIRVWKHLPPSLEVLCWPTTVAFSLTTKQWGHVLVDGLDDIKRDESAWNQLELPNRTKEILMAMATSALRGKNKVSSQMNSKLLESSENLHEESLHVIKRLQSNPRYKLQDVIDGKSGGNLFLLYGAPGTGKTLSVEALSSFFGRPLYSISFAELGSNVSELEERLTDILMLAAHWGALVLLDEGDALVERREKGQFLINSMTGVLLKLLENFEGALFITSNRASYFDPAALSRVTLALKFEPLDFEARKSMWRNTLARVLAGEQADGVKLRDFTSAIELANKTFDLAALAKFEGSGRAVNAVVKLAISLAEHRLSNLNQAVLEDAIKLFEDFHLGLEKEGIYKDWSDK